MTPAAVWAGITKLNPAAWLAALANMNPLAVFMLPVCYILHLYVLYQFLMPRENARKKLIICLVMVFFLQIMTRIFFMAAPPLANEYNVPKLLTILSVFLMVFVGGSCVYGATNPRKEERRPRRRAKRRRIIIWKK